MVQRGEIYYVNLGSNLGSEQSGYRPVLIIQNDTGNKYSPTTIVATLTSKEDWAISTIVLNIWTTLMQKIIKENS